MDYNGIGYSEKTNLKLLAFKHRDMVIGQDDEVRIRREFQHCLIFRLN